MIDHLELHGCRHDIPGHYLKAIGLLRVLAKCADAAYCDPDAEGWWETAKACFCLRARKSPTRERLVEQTNSLTMNADHTKEFEPFLKA